MRSDVESMSNVSQVGMSPARTVAGDDEQLTEESVEEETAAVESSAKPAEESVGDKTASGRDMAQSQNVHLQSSPAADLHASSMASLGNGTDKRGGDGSNRIPTVNTVTPKSQPATEGSRQVTERTSNSHDRTVKTSPQDLNRPRLNSRSSRIEALLNETSEASEERPHAGFSSARQAAVGTDKEWGLEALSSAKSLPPAEKSSRPHSAVAKRRRSSPSKLVFLAESALHPDEDYAAVRNVRAGPDQAQQNSESGAGVAPVKPTPPPDNSKPGAGVAPVKPTPPPDNSKPGAGVAPVKPTLPSGHNHTNALLKEEEQQQQQQSKSPDEEERATAKTSRSNRESGTSGGGGDGDAAHNQDMVEPHENLEINPSPTAEADAGGNHNDSKDDGGDGDVESDDGGAADEDDEDADNADDDDSQKADQKTPSKGAIPGNPPTPGRVVVKQGKRGGGKGTASQGGQSGRTSGKRTARRSNASSRKSRRKAENKEAAELEGKEDSREPGRLVDEGATFRDPSTRRTTQKSSSQGTESTTESESAPPHRQQEEESGSEKSSQEGSGSPTGSSREDKTDSHSNRKKMRKDKKPPAVKKERTWGRAVTEADNSAGYSRRFKKFFFYLY
ncbi:hypothetical protein CBR_g38813 [Chara braunii]|uniref:Uncharacterized protein n=1 Tax=Chara braunii TaxID=69332 RepID=A0A388LQI3_CHABU|nr:hypothetical protein CBR_g38813 [Chara braunii]|eukprot:GBG84531.1 hypothetical protein CBR_g38813 [Chara braunii]